MKEYKDIFTAPLWSIKINGVSCTEEYLSTLPPQVVAKILIVQEWRTQIAKKELELTMDRRAMAHLVDEIVREIQPPNSDPESPTSEQ